jgi:uncharacterized protein
MVNGESEEKSVKISFFRKQADVCPVCGEEFFREEILTGRGRLIAGNLTDELRRLYQENKRYGVVVPNIYSILVCPQCYFAAFDSDFSKLNDKLKERLRNTQLDRVNFVNKLFPGLEFKGERNIEHGLCSYMLAMSCYSYLDVKYTPTLRRGQCALRIAWILDDMYEHYKEPVFQQMQKLFYKKAARYWGMSLYLSQNGKEPIDGTKYIGPDTDNNFGYDGLLFVTGTLQYRVITDEKDIEKKGKELVKVRRIMAKLYGGGKASKDKPKDILNKAKDYYELIGDEIKRIEAEVGYKFD